jgi:hypothetical protein
MTDHDRLSYYKALKQQNIALTGDQQTDYIRIANERGEASASAMPRGSVLYEIAKQTL